MVHRLGVERVDDVSHSACDDAVRRVSEKDREERKDERTT